MTMKKGGQSDRPGGLLRLPRIGALCFAMLLVVKILFLEGNSAFFRSTIICKTCHEGILQLL